MPIHFNDLSFAFDPHGPTLLRDITLGISAPRVGIVGRNGSGKSTLLRLIAGDLSPTRGTITVDGRVARLRQDLLQAEDLTVAGLLGIDGKLAALAAIETGSLDQHHYDTLGDDWDVESRAEAVLARRVPSLALDGALHRPTSTLSGGELVQLGLAALELEGAAVALLDEPTNNLDRRSRETLYAAVASWPGQVVVVSHDVALLDRMDAIVELHGGVARLFGGNFTDYRAQLAVEAAAAAQSVRAAHQKVRAEQRERDHVQTAMARREQQGKKAAREKRAPGIILNTWKDRSQKSRGAEQIRAAEKVEAARERLAEAESLVRDDASIRIPLVDPGLARGRRLVELRDADRTLVMQGGDRWALVGDNGVGKTTLLRGLTPFTPRVGHLDQRLDLPPGTVLDVVRGSAPDRPAHDTHALLARFLLRGEVVHRHVDSLSGGERFRVALARILLADPPPELIVLDEPTNNLDLDSIDQLVDALTAYRGALLVVSHDQSLLDRLGLDRVVELTREGTLVG